jgi:hypothetical protein
MTKILAALRIVVLAILTILTMSEKPAAAQLHVTPSDIEVIKNELESMKSEVADLKRQLGEVLRTQSRLVQDTSNNPTSRMRATLTDAPVLGRPDAPVRSWSFLTINALIVGHFS